MPFMWGGDWSPSEHQICMAAGGRYPELPQNYPTGLWIYDLQTGRATKRLRGWVVGSYLSPPEEKRLAFHLGQPLYEIWIAPMTSLEPVQTEEEHHLEAIARYARLIGADPSDPMNHLGQALHLIHRGEEEKVLEAVEALGQDISPSMALGCQFLAFYMTSRPFHGADPNVAIRLAQISWRTTHLKKTFSGIL